MTSKSRIMPNRTLLFAGFVLAAAMMPMATMAQEATPAAESQPAAESNNGSGEGWSWAVTPYLWASSISTNLKKDGAPEFGTETEFEDLLSKLDMAFQIHVEGQGDRFGAFADVTYIALSDSKDRTIYSSDTSLDTSFVEVAGVWNVDPARFEGLDLFAGVRHIQAGTDVELDPVDPLQSTVNLKFDQSFTDFMVGARYNATLSERWGMTLRADGGWGDTDTDYSVSALLRYKMHKGSMIVGYRYMELGVAGDSQDLGLTLSGPVFGFAFGL
jgi:hypothetical protein